MSNDKFEWTDELVRKYLDTKIGGTIQDMEYFKEQEMKRRKERIKVAISGNGCIGEPIRVYPLKNDYAISRENFDIIKEAIERVLNPPETAAEKTDKDWEILSVKSFNGGIARKTLRHFDNQRGNKGSEYRFVWDDEPDGFGYYENFILGSDTNSIHSVRRISDGEVFTVGDEIGWGELGDFRTKLVEFRITKERLEIGYNIPGILNAIFVDFEEAVRLHKKAPIKSAGIQDEFNGSRLYTQSELDKAVEDAFEAARAIKEDTRTDLQKHQDYFIGIYKWEVHKYQKFSDYKAYLNTQKTKQ